ncbi:MAG: 4Fe-4S dicluster domain-containing protein [Planctomycetes bacterium]|nr:4Fe-4S dicluster domain-containing protein [Planctomycetota bacterium]
MQYGFLLDHHRCIGCHACTVACKAENEVPVSNFRTWVKYQEKGRFPAVKRHFAVLRCNHCSKPPCVAICPVNALSKRKDGIVDLDKDACIGCRACMQGCPYDAIYLNEDSGSAEKCHYCAHRVEKGLEPACVIVCPEQAIVSGDLDDPNSRIARMLAENETLVRRPEQGTGPNVHYKGVEPSMLKPGAAERPETYLWSDRPPHKREAWPADVPTEPDNRVVLDAGHRVEWGWHVAAYLVTKGVAAGAAVLAPFLGLLGVEGFARDWLPESAALLLTLVTTFLLVHDLARPMLFFRLITRPNTRSWLVKGGWILSAFGVLLPVAIALRFLGMTEAADALRWLNAAIGLGVAGYTAFLFQQCEGRDLWQGKLVLPHLCVQAVVCGAALYLPFANAPETLSRVLGAALVLHLVVMLAEQRRKHFRTENERQATGFLAVVSWGPFKSAYFAAKVIGCALPAVLVLAAGFVAPAVGATALLAAAGACVLFGLYLFEHSFVRAGQLPPLS